MKVPRLFLISHEGVKLLRQQHVLRACLIAFMVPGPRLKEFFYE